MLCKIYSLLLLFTLSAAASVAQRVATFQVEVEDDRAFAVPVRVDLDAITHLPDSVLYLVAVQGRNTRAMPFQIHKNGRRFLHWMIAPQSGGPKKLTFALQQGRPPGTVQEAVEVAAEEGHLTIRANGKNLLRYNYETVYPPQGVDTVFKRSGFIHPLWSPHGQVLTRLSPPDHYHHFGIWNPWTKVKFEGETVDFWNLAKKQGTVRFAGFASVTDGPVFGEYKALHEHVVFEKDGGEKVAMNEVQSVRIYRPGGSQDYYIADITIQLNPATASPVLLEEYRYGGLGWRATEKWNRDNSRVLTSGGRARKEADGTNARWCLVAGAIDGDSAGVVMMSFPANYNHPEPLRIWPEDSNGRGDMYANFSPTRDMDWRLESGENYLLRYRFLVFNGSVPRERAEEAWQAFARPPRVTVKISRE